MIEEYSSFLDMICIKNIFIYCGDTIENISPDTDVISEKICLDGLCRYLIIYGYQKVCKEFIYEDNTLIKIDSQWEDGDHWIQDFYYKNDKLTLIRAVADNGYSKIDYTTARPDFKKIRELIYNRISEKLNERKNNTLR